MKNYTYVAKKNISAKLFINDDERSINKRNLKYLE